MVIMMVTIFVTRLAFFFKTYLISGSNTANSFTSVVKWSNGGNSKKSIEWIDNHS